MTTIRERVGYVSAFSAMAMSAAYYVSGRDFGLYTAAGAEKIIEWIRVNLIAPANAAPAEIAAKTVSFDTAEKVQLAILGLFLISIFFLSISSVFPKKK